MNNRVRYSMDEVQRNTFYQMPKFLFADEFKKLSSDARVLYSLLRDRHNLSIKNQWFNDNGEVYLIFSRENMCDMLNLSEKTITKAMNDLKNHKLIDEQRRGQGKPNLIYLLTLESIDFTENRKIYGSRKEIFTIQDREIFPPNNTNINNTDKNQSQSQSHDTTLTTDIEKQDNDAEFKKGSSVNSHISHEKKTEETQAQDNYIKHKKILQENISYDNFTKYDKELIDELVDCALDVICTKGETVKVNGEEKNRDMVISQYLKLNMYDIEHVLDRYKNQRHKITHVHNYLKTMLYTVKQENSHYYANAVRVDGLVR